MRLDKDDWASKHQAEYESLQLVDKHTQIPAPTTVVLFQYSSYSYLVRIQLSSQPVGALLPNMTDQQVGRMML
jgi:hypothetical protein